MDRDILKEGGAFCVGIIATGFGIAGAGLGATISGIALLTVTSVWYSEHRAARKRVEAALEQFGRGFERDRDVDAAALAKLDARFRAALRQFTVERDELRGLLKGGNFEGAVAARFLKQWGVDKENLPSAHMDYLHGLIVAGLCAAMEDKKFRDAIMLQGVLAVLENQQGQIPRALFENIALRFQHDNPDAPVPELEACLKDKAKEWKDLKARLAELEASNARVANVRAEAEAAIENGEFEAARELLDGVAEVRTDAALEALRQVAEVHGLKADTFLLQGDADAAAESMEVGAELFSGVDKLEKAIFLLNAGERLRSHGELFGGKALPHSITFNESAIPIFFDNQRIDLWARAQNNAGCARRFLAEALPDPEASALLEQAISELWAAIGGFDQSCELELAATARSNLGNALQTKAKRVSTRTAIRLFDEAISAYEQSLTYFNKQGRSFDWANSYYNLWIARQSKAEILDENIRETLECANKAFVDTLSVFKLGEHPKEWLWAKNAIGANTSMLAALAFGKDRQLLYEAAISVFCSTAEVCDEGGHPMVCSMLQRNLALAFMKLAKCEGATSSEELLSDSIKAYRAALEAYKRPEQLVDWAVTQEGMGLAYEALGDHAEERRMERYGQALRCFDAAGEAFQSVFLESSWARCQVSRDRVAGKLKGLE